MTDLVTLVEAEGKVEVGITSAFRGNRTRHFKKERIPLKLSSSRRKASISNRCLILMRLAVGIIEDVMMKLGFWSHSCTLS